MKCPNCDEEIAAAPEDGAVTCEACGETYTEQELHDNHEYIDTDCRLCREAIEPEMRDAQARYRGSKPYDRDLQEAADNDRELQRDEFHR